MDVKELEGVIERKFAQLNTQVETKTADANKAVEGLKIDFIELGKKYAELQEKGASASDLDAMQKHLDQLDVKMQKSGGSAQTKTFNQNLGEAIENATDELKAFAGKKGGEMSIQMKAAGDMSTANFTGGSYASLTTDVRQAPLIAPDRTVYLRDILPSGTTDAGTITYPRAIGGEGAPAVWTPGTTKPIFDFDFDSKTVNVQWIAGIVRVPRAMLDDVKFLRSYLQANMLKALLKAENAEILNGDGSGQHLLGLMPQATAYDGDFTLMIEQIVDAAHGQIADKGFNASNVIMNARDAVKVALNKASGSGEYDLPPGTVGYVDGRLTIAGLNVLTLGSNQMPATNWLAGDFSAAQLITRLNPELRIFEQNKDDVEKNMVTIRIEERIALATYFPDAFVKNAGV